MMRTLLLCLTIVAELGFGSLAPAQVPSIRFEFVPGPINGAVIHGEDGDLVVYGDPELGRGPIKPANVQVVLLPHHRRDLAWAARPLIDSSAIAWAPVSEQALFERPGEFWTAFTQTRYNDSAQRTTKVLERPIPIARWVAGGETIDWQDLEVHVVDTPGFTPGSVSYLIELEGRKLAFTGDLIFGDGQILDLYSFQSDIGDARIGGYHGYGGRLAELVSSLKAIRATEPDVIIPARGAIIENPIAAIDRLIGRVQSLYRNYLSTNALHWYFKEERMRICGERVLGAGADIQLMPYAEHVKAPEWVWERGTSRMIVSESGAGLLLDCWHQNVIDGVDELMQAGTIDRVEGIFVTHYHDDHTARVQDASVLYDCPVYATDEYADILEHPSAYHMPAQLKNAINQVTRMHNGQQMRWHEFELTFYYFPGQAIYHGALLVQRDGEVPIFFIGDSFAPSGIDDYCVQNRNLVHADVGYLLCLQKLREIQGDYWLINQHIPYVFRFTDEEMAYLESRYRARISILEELFPWDDPNYGIDEQWAVFYPYGVETTPGSEITLEVRLVNHSPVKRTFNVTPRLGAAMKLVDGDSEIELDSRASGAVRFRITVPNATGEHLVRADVSSEGMRFNDWIESLISVK